jgi:hypothetical protein
VSHGAFDAGPPSGRPATRTTVFDALSIDREHSRWEDHVWTPTPWEQRGGVWFKREDYFAPLGYGGVNGSKLRQCIHLLKQARDRGCPGVLSGASVKSPQLSMGTAVARHFGMESAHVLGATTPRTAMHHPNVEVAAWLGARFRVLKVAYNPALQAEVRRLLAGQLRGWYQLEYGISVGTETSEPAAVEAFHRLGSAQVANMPADVETLYLPAGSCNTCVSVLYGLAIHRLPVKRVVLFGIGPNRLQWIDDRLRTIELAIGRPGFIRSLFIADYRHSADLTREHNARPKYDPPYVLTHHDLHETKWVSYQDERPFAWEGISFHPTYEGKVMTYMRENQGEFGEFWKSGGRAGFWIVGSKPLPAAMLRTLRSIGERPEHLPLLVPA